MAGKFVLRKTDNEQFHFEAGNGETSLTSETDTAKPGDLKDIASVRANAPLYECYERKTASDGSPYFILKAATGETLGTSERYSSLPPVRTALPPSKPTPRPPEWKI
jgi:uncharacterized protein YegP (UPF0339 family)